MAQLIDQITKEFLDYIKNDDVVPLKYIAKFIRRRLNKDIDLVIGWTGNEGSGKSTGAINMSKIIDPDFDLIKNVSYIPNADEVIKEYTALKPTQSYIIDEAVRVIHKYKWASRSHREIIDFFSTERKQRKCVFLLMPRFSDFSEFFRNHRIRIWIHTITRGLAVMYLRDDDPHNIKDVWHMEENFKLKKKLSKGQFYSNLPDEQKLYLEGKMQGYICHFTYGDLDEETKPEYLRLNLEARQEIERITKDNKESIAKSESTIRLERDNEIAQNLRNMGCKEDFIGQALKIKARTLRARRKTERDKKAKVIGIPHDNLNKVNTDGKLSPI